METTNVEHNFLTEKTKDYLKTLFKDKNHSDFVKRQKEKNEKIKSIFLLSSVAKTKSIKHSV